MLTSYALTIFSSKLIEIEMGLFLVLDLLYDIFRLMCIFTASEMYPECVIAFWDALILLLDAENIEQWVQLDAEKKSNVYANYKLQEKNSVTRYANLCFVKTIFIS